VLRFRLMVKNEVRVYGLKHQKEKRSMDHFAGLDVSVKETSVCIVDDTGKIVREVKVASEPEALLALLKNPLGSVVMRRAKKRKNLSSARHYDQIRFRFRTTKTRSGLEWDVVSGPKIDGSGEEQPFHGL
jgi:hypothetical protein